MFSLAHRWGPLIIWMAGIFYFSSRSRPLGPLSGLDHSMGIGKVAHCIEYAGLAALLYRALSSERRQARKQNPNTPRSLPKAVSGSQAGIFDPAGHRPSTVAFAVALTFAVLDEFHQEFVPGRNFSLPDIGYDLAGIIVALCVIWIFGRLWPLPTEGFLDHESARDGWDTSKSNRNSVNEK